MKTNLNQIFCCLTIVIANFIFTFNAQCKTKSAGVGAVIGSPTGLTGKLWLDATHAVDTTLAWNTSGYSAVHIHADYLTEKIGKFKTSSYPIDLFYGIGGRVSSYSSKDRNGIGLGLRAPLGLSYQMYDPNIEFFGEIAAVLELVPSTDVILNIGIGGRYYF